MRTMMVMALALTLMGCGDRDKVDFSGDELGVELHSILSEDGFVEMGLTREWVYFALSDSARSEAQAEIREDAEADGVRGFFGGLMQSVLGKALDFRAKFAVSEIEDIRWEDGRMRFVFEDPDRRIDENLQIGEDGSVTEAFSEEQVRAFAEVFRAVKEGGGGTGQ